MDIHFDKKPSEEVVNKQEATVELNCIAQDLMGVLDDISKIQSKFDGSLSEVFENADRVIKQKIHDFTHKVADYSQEK